MSLEAELKKAMGYTDDISTRCPACTHNPTGSSCEANRALAFDVSPDGRCDVFSAKRPRRAGRSKVDQTEEVKKTSAFLGDGPDADPEEEHDPAYTPFTDEELEGDEK